MDWQIFALLSGAGVAGGLINALAGGATLLTFPAMLAAGLPPVIANASNAVAIAPGHAIAALADWQRLPRFDARFAGLALVTLIGGTGGAVLLLIIPERLFVLPVPALIGFATLLFAAAPKIQAWTKMRQNRRHGANRTSFWGRTALAATAVYGGFFGAGLGVLLTAVLAITEGDDLRSIKVMKNLLATIVSVATVFIFSFRGVVRWPETLIMLAGAVIGGYVGGHLIRVLPASVVRRIVIIAGTGMTLIYARQYWF
jgi:uncharacterized membrane protein YfcA